MSNLEKKNFDLVVKKLEKWQGRDEWFFNREHTDVYEDYYEGPYKRAEVWQKRVLSELLLKDDRVQTLLEYGCGTTRFTRWWGGIGIEATGADISPSRLAYVVRHLAGVLVLGYSHGMPVGVTSIDARAFL